MVFLSEKASGGRGSDGNEGMIQRQIVDRGITNSAVIDALRNTDRCHFVPDDEMGDAYGDHPIMLMPGATVSQPYIVALMTDLLRVGPTHRVLEVGTGSGYQAAVLSLLALSVYSVELQADLVEFARERLRRLQRNNVMVINGDGWKGYRGAAPYDRILVTAAPSVVPQDLVDQLAPAGRMVVPVGEGQMQDLLVIDKSATGEINQKVHSGVHFVPLVSQDLPDPMRERLG